MLKTAILDDYQDVARSMADWSVLIDRVDVTSFHDHIDDRDTDRLVERLRDFDCIVAMRERTRFGADLLERLPKLRLLVTTGGANAAIDIEAAARRGVPVCATRSVPYPTTELTWALILALVRRIPQESASLRAGHWQNGLGGQLQGSVLGILGLGRIGTTVALIGKAFGMQVIAWSQNLTAEKAAAVQVEYVSKEVLFARADVLSLHVSLSARTRGIVGDAELAMMKRTAYLVNTARGPVVDDAALVRALRAGTIAGAAIDVYEHEPLAADHPFRTLDNLLMTPHIGYVTEETYRVYFNDVVEDIDAWLKGAPVRLLNRPV
jgi:phosphoglycerate dehydrogenase-like enzyme